MRASSPSDLAARSDPTPVLSSAEGGSGSAEQTPAAGPSLTLEQQRQAVRRRALSNFILVLLTQAARTAGRMGVQPFAQDAIRLVYRDVRTLVHGGDVYQWGVRDFEVVLLCPMLWPFDRSAAVVPYIVAPDDFVHPNSDGRAICIDLAGVLPELIPGLVYDNIRMARHHFRLDHYVDPHAADYVRAHLEECPADARALYVDTEEEHPAVAGFIAGDEAAGGVGGAESGPQRSAAEPRRGEGRSR